MFQNNSVARSEIYLQTSISRALSFLSAAVQQFDDGQVLTSESCADFYVSSGVLMGRGFRLALYLEDAVPIGLVEAVLSKLQGSTDGRLSAARRMTRKRLGAPYIKANGAVLASVESECSEVAISSRRICIIVCGMHRTGTSAVARVVNLLGADVSKNLVSPDAANVRGYWEPSAVVQVHNQLLEALGTSSADPLPPQRDWLELA